MVNFWAPDTVPARFSARKLYRWNPNVTLMRTDVEESATLGRTLAQRINRSTGPLTVLLPLRGVSQLDSEGGDFWWPEADAALFAAVREHLRPDIPVIELDMTINDPRFAERAAQALLELIKTAASWGARSVDSQAATGAA